MEMQGSATCSEEKYDNWYLVRWLGYSKLECVYLVNYRQSECGSENI